MTGAYLCLTLKVTFENRCSEGSDGYLGADPSYNKLGRKREGGSPEGEPSTDTQERVTKATYGFRRKGRGRTDSLGIKSISLSVHASIHTNM